MPHVRELSELVARAERVLAFTGAGVSTASNIPDYRGKNGVWKTRTPVQFGDFMNDEDSRIEYWSYKLEGYAAFRNARPNAAHQALVALEHLGKLEAVVTQNIDGLHRTAGTSADKLVELHGTHAEVVCMGCKERTPIAGPMEEFERTRRPPRCARCGGMLKPGVIMFGEALDLESLRRAHAAARRADLVLSLGSSLVVTPAADVPLTAARRGAPYVIVNQGATPHDAIATFTIDDEVGSVLEAAVGPLLRR